MRPNRIKQMWRDGKCVTMGWLSVSHGFTAEVMARQGFDTLCVDMQHGTTDMNDVWPMLQAISQTDTVPVVRVPWNDPPTIMKALDLGAYGIIVPLINTAEDAAKAVAACRYPPVGMRSSGPVRAVHYGGSDYLAKANDEIVIMAMIETKEGLANLDAICATPGLDAVYIGPSDLSFALGHGAPGRQPRSGAHRHLRQDPRGGAQARDQGGHALRERGLCRRRGEARLRHGHADLRPGLDDRRRPQAARRSQGRDGVTPERFARGLTFDDYVRFAGSPDNLAREGFDVRRFSLTRPRLDWSAYLRERYAKARLTDDQAAAMQWLAGQPGGPAKIAVIAEDWSSDCRRDLPYLARLAEAGGLELRVFVRDGDTMLRKGLPDPAAGGNADLVVAYANDKGGQQFASVPVAVFYSSDWGELYRYVEYPAIYHKERLLGHLRATQGDIAGMLESPFFDVWAHAAIAEILSALYERRMALSQ